MITPSEPPHRSAALSPGSDAPPVVSLSIDRIVVDCPPGVRPGLLREEIERHLRAECERRTAGGPPSPRPEPRTPPRIHAARHPSDYAARIARAVADRLWP